MLFVVQNTFQGDGTVSCLVEATDILSAIELARPVFQASGEGRASGGFTKYPARYWESLTAKPVQLLELFESDL